LVVTEATDSAGLYRCDVTTGKCTLLRSEKAPNSMVIVRH
jgi:hypothetical protein